MLVGLFVLLLILVVLIIVPGLNQIGYGSNKGTTAQLQKEDKTKVTGAPLSLPDYLWDAEIPDGETIDLRPFISSTAILVPGILDESGIRIHFGQNGSARSFQLQWDAGSGGAPLELTLFDALERPLGYWKNTSGVANTVLPGGLYKLVLSSQGLLGEDFSLTAAAVKTGEPANLTSLHEIGIPTIDIKMSEASFQSWDVQRASFAAQIKSPTDIVDTSGCKKVLADILTDGGQRTAQLWAAGLGDPVHFSATSPSLTGKVVSGQLLFGMSRFKLYSIRVTCGLLDYVASSIMLDEGIVTPRQFMVSVTLNGNNLGLYLLEEMIESQGFFASIPLYDGQIFSDGELLADPAPADGMAALKSISIEEERSRDFVEKVNQTKFAKCLALLSCLQATHATQGGDFRLYRDPYLDLPEPVIRDLNVNTKNDIQSGLFMHTGWWLGWHPIGRGNSFTPKVFPPDESLSNQYSFFFGAVHPSVNLFVSLPEKREIFDRYLMYALDGAFQQRFSRRMQSVFLEVYPYLSTQKIPVLPGGGQPYRNFDSELDWIQDQINAVVSGQLITPRTVTAMLEKSSLLIDTTPPVPSDEEGFHAVTLYNLSPFSARLKLPDYAHIADNSPVIIAGKGDEGWYLAPSLLFPEVVSVDPDAPQELNPYPLTQRAARRFLSLERLRFSQSDCTKILVPLVDVLIPDEKYSEFMSWFESNSIATVGSTYELPAERNILIGNLLVTGTEAPATGLSQQDEPSPDIVVILPLSLEQIGTKNRYTLLISNFSREEVTLDLARMRWIDSGTNGYVTYSINTVWRPGDNPERSGSSIITLGAANMNTTVNQSLLDSPVVWTGALKGLLAGSVDDTMSNCALVEFDFEHYGDFFFLTDAGAMAESAYGNSSPIRIIVQEPNLIYLPVNETLSVSPGKDYQSAPGSVIVSVSDYATPHKGTYLIDLSEETYWHIKNPPETTRHWVKIDFGEPVTMTGLDILPRIDFSGQLWDGDNAVVQGSNKPDNETGWVSLAALHVNKTELEKEDRHWIPFTFLNTNAYRYYRLLINDPSFYSIAEMEFQVSEWSKSIVELPELLNQGLFELTSGVGGSPPVIRFKDKNAVISEIIKIPAGYVLQIEPGSNLTFTRNAGILSYSPIRAIGTIQEPIVFAPAEGSTSWMGVDVVKAIGTSEFRHVQMSRANNGVFGEVQSTGGLEFMKTAVIITDTELLDFQSQDGLHLTNTSFEINGLTMKDSYDDSIDCDWGRGTITNATIIGSGGDGIDFCGVYATITNTTSQGSANKGISIGEGSVVTVKGCRLIGNLYGIAAKDQSIVRLVDSEITGNEFGVLRYIKKAYYVYPDLFLENNQTRENKTDIYEEDPSTWTRQFDQ
jgi:hypothetical protein